MPKKTAYPRLRTHVRKGAKGQVWVSYWFDRRQEGLPDLSLGNDYAGAIEKWREIAEHKPRIKGTLMEAFERWEKEVLPTYDSAETRKGYGRSLANLKPTLGPATWDQVTPKTITGYLKARSAKTQGNREMALLSVIWAWALTEELVRTKFPLLGIRGWKNKEQARTVEVSDVLFAAIYTEGSPLLRNVMDLASATGLRLTDCRNVQLPPGDVLRVRSSKTGKTAEFSLVESSVLTRLVSERRKNSATHLLLLSNGTKPVSARMLRDHWDEARKKAALKNPELAQEIRGLYLRDMRKLAADLAENEVEASQLLQHSSVELTKRHYRTKPTRLKPVR